MKFKTPYFLPKQRPVRNRLFSVMGAMLIAAVAWGENATPSPDRVIVPLHDPSRPGLLKVKVGFGAITVKGYDGKEIVVEARTHKSSSGHSEKSVKKAEDSTPPEEAPKSPKRNELAMSGVKIEEDDNVVSVKVNRQPGPFELMIQVPFKTSLQLGSSVDGVINVENVEGEIEVNNLNGGIVLTGVSGSVVAHSVNGKVLARLDKSAPGKPMSFSTVNGGIDVTLPPETAANVKMESLNGKLVSEFEIASGKPTRNSDPGTPKVVRGPINGGGPDFQFRTVNGNVHLRRTNAIVK